MSEIKLDSGEVIHYKHKIKFYPGMSYQPKSIILASDKRIIIEGKSWLGRPYAINVLFQQVQSVKLKRANPIMSFLLWSCFHYIHLVYKQDTKLKKIKFFCFGGEYSRYWGTRNKATKKLFAMLKLYI